MPSQPLPPAPRPEAAPESAPNPAAPADNKKRLRRRRRIATFLMLLAILLLLGSIGYISFKRFDVDPLATATPIPTPTPTEEPSATPTPTPPPNTYDPGQAFEQVQAFYNDYGQNASVLTKYVTPQLAQSLNSGGSSATGVYCTFNVPSSISYKAPVAGDNSASVVADESFVNGPDINVMLTVSLSTLLITAIACPQ